MEGFVVTWDAERWPSFSVAALTCRCGCGTFVQNDAALDKIQALHDLMQVEGDPSDRQIVLEAATRCPAFNAAEDGAPDSEHLTGGAFDIVMYRHDRMRLLNAARQVGFTGIGFNTGTLHVDAGSTTRQWDHGAPSQRAWQGIMPSP